MKKWLGGNPHHLGVEPKIGVFPKSSMDVHRVWNHEFSPSILGLAFGLSAGFPWLLPSFGSDGRTKIWENSMGKFSSFHSFNEIKSNQNQYHFIPFHGNDLENHLVISINFNIISFHCIHAPKPSMPSVHHCESSINEQKFMNNQTRYCHDKAFLRETNG